MWELLSHARPFDVLTQREVVLVVNVGRRPKFPEGTPKQLVAIVERCWEQTAKKRPAFKTVVSWLDELIRNYEELVNAAAAAILTPEGAPPGRPTLTTVGMLQRVWFARVWPALSTQILAAHHTRPGPKQTVVVTVEYDDG